MSGIARIWSIRTGNLKPLRVFQCLPINAVFFCGSVRNSNLGVRFPLRCFQRLSFGNIATRRYYWRNNRHTRDSPREVLSYCPQLSSKFQRFYRIESDIIVLNYLKTLCFLSKPTIARRIRPYLHSDFSKCLTYGRWGFPFRGLSCWLTPPGRLLLHSKNVVLPDTECFQQIVKFILDGGQDYTNITKYTKPLCD